MGMSVRTAHGKDFWRCGIKFGAEPTVIPEAKLAEPFGSKKLKQTVRDVLGADRMLVCADAPDPKDPEGEKPAEGDKAKKPEKAK